MTSQTASADVKLPRVAITYCTQCKWMLRAGYFGQELLSTFGTSIGEIALIPATGGIFTVHLTYVRSSSEQHIDQEASQKVEQVLLWDRKAEGGFPETKILKQLVRNHIEPDKNLGHSDTPSKKATSESKENAVQQPTQPKSQEVPAATANGAAECEDCK